MKLTELSGMSMFVALGLLASCVQADLNHLVPAPVTLTARTDTFTVPKQLLIFADGAISDSSVCWVKKLFDQLHVANPSSYDTAVHTQNRGVAHVKLLIVANATIGAEGYVLTITKDSITIEAQTTTGQFYAIQTIRQMLPPQIENARNLPLPQKLPGCVITDYPRFVHRGMHIDICRHFFGIAYLRQLIDRIALFKGNILHVHLTDDQGWRIQIFPPASATGSTITAYNNLTAFSGQKEIPGASCPDCYFTQAAVRDSLVKYAMERKVTIIPEIDMPGHIQAAIAAFAQAGITISSNCFNPCNQLFAQSGVGQSKLQINPVSPVVDTFIKTVWTQVAAVFPSPYLHMGGDESADTVNFGNFIRRVETIVNGLGRKLMGWEEIYSRTSNPTSISQTWNAANDHPNSIYSPCNKLYYDQSEGSGSGYNNYCASNVTLQVTYSASTSIANHFGVEGCVWTENISQASGLADRNMWPRHSACGELGWSSSASLNFSNFAVRMQPFGCRYACMGVRNWYHDGLVTWQTCAADSSAMPTNALSNYAWQLIPPVTGVNVIQKKVPVCFNFSRLSNAEYRVFDVYGRLRGASSGKDLAAFNRTNATAGGIFFVVDRQGNIAQKVFRNRNSSTQTGGEL